MYLLYREENNMEYSKIIENLLSDSEQIAQCESELVNIKAKEVSTNELIQAARYLSLNKINFETRANASDSFKEIFRELDSIIDSISMFSTTNNDANENNNTGKSNNRNDDTVISLQLSSIIDSVLQGLSKNEQKIYIYRYFICYPLDTIATLCGSSIGNVTKVISSTNTLLRKELQNTNIQFNAKTLLQSFADIDVNYLNIAISDNKKENADILAKHKKRNNGTTKKFSISWKKLLNVSFAVLFVVLVIGNLYLITDGFNPKNLSFTSNDDTKLEEVNKNKYEYIIREINGKLTVDIDQLLSYCSYEQNYNLSLTYDSTYFVGTYREIAFDEAVPLDKCIGTEIIELRANNKKYYQLKGINSKQYIIEKYDSIYKLHCLESVAQRNDLNESILGVKFSEVLANYYGLSLDQQIESITVKHAGTSANFDDINVRRLIEESNDVYKIFDIMYKSVCTGETLSIVSSDPNYSYNYLMESSVQLFIEKPDGTIIDSIYYRPGYYYFFDALTMITFTPLAEDDVIFSNYDPSNMDIRPGDEYEIIQSDGEEILVNNTNNNGRYLDSMLGFAHHKTKPIDPADWSIKTEIQHADLNNIQIEFSHVSFNMNGLYIGSDFTLEKLENDQWVELKINNGYSAENKFKFNHYIKTNYDETSFEDIFITNKYNRPEKDGLYRITITIYDSNSQDLNNPNHRDYTMEFTFD